MAKYEIKFFDMGYSEDFIKVEQENNYVCIEGVDGENLFMIELDKSTAIKFAKTLRTEINKIDSEVSNG